MSDANLTCDVIIPIGPGHKQLAMRAAASVDQAANYNMGPFKAIQVLAINDTMGMHGRSKARNDGVSQSEADWLFFLDADDVMDFPAFQIMNRMCDTYDAVWGQICEFRDNLMIPRFQVPIIESFEQLVSYDPFMTIQMGHFVRRQVARVHPFNESLNTGEDWDYYLRVWKSYSCIKMDFPLMGNQRGLNSTGPRSADGAAWREAVEGMLAQYRGERIPAGTTDIHLVDPTDIVLQ